MKKFALTVAAAALSTTALADISSGNSDLDGWVVEDRSIQRTYGQQAYSESRALFASEDTYGSIIFDPDVEYAASSSQAGVGDSYGSVLHSVGFDW